MLFPVPTYKTLSPIKNFLLLLAILLTSYITVWFLGSSPLLASVIIAVPGILFLLYVKSWKLLVTMVFAALIGTGHEIFFIQQGYWSYHEPSFFSVPAYLPFIWANIGLLSVALYKGLLLIDIRHPLLHRLPHFRSALFLTVATLSLALLALYLFAPKPGLLVIIFLALDVLYVWSMRSIPLAIVGICTFVAGAIGDLVSVPLGIWSYPVTSASFLGVPVYIFAYWDIIGIMLAGMYATLETLDQKTSEPL